MNEIFDEAKKVTYEPPMTNADRIRAMTDEELVGFIIRGTEYDQFFVDEAFNGSCDGWLEYNELLRWLQQPAEEG